MMHVDPDVLILNPLQDTLQLLRICCRLRNTDKNGYSD